MGILPFSFKNTTARCFFHLAYGGLLITISLICANIQIGDCVSVETSPLGWGNGTTSVADEYFTHDSAQEFIGDSEFRNVLVDRKPRTFGYGAILDNGPKCSTINYGKCIPGGGRTSRSCPYRTFCAHSPGR